MSKSSLKPTRHRPLKALLGQKHPLLTQNEARMHMKVHTQSTPQVKPIEHDTYGLGTAKKMNMARPWEVALPHILSINHACR